MSNTLEQYVNALSDASRVNENQVVYRSMCPCGNQPMSISMTFNDQYYPITFTLRTSCESCHDRYEVDEYATIARQFKDLIERGSFSHQQIAFVLKKKEA